MDTFPIKADTRGAKGLEQVIVTVLLLAANLTWWLFLAGFVAYGVRTGWEFAG